jgi:hypothetical protein
VNLPWGGIRRGSRRSACVQATVPISPRCCRQPGKQRAYRPNAAGAWPPITAAAVRDRRYMNAKVADVMDSSPQTGAGDAHGRGSEGMAMSRRCTTLLRTLSASVATGARGMQCERHVRWHTETAHNTDRHARPVRPLGDSTTPSTSTCRRASSTTSSTPGPPLWVILPVLESSPTSPHSEPASFTARLLARRLGRYVVSIGRRGDFSYTFDQLRSHGVEIHLGH